MPNRYPIRDPRTVARDIPGMLDIVFPRLSGGLVAALNRNMFQFNSVTPLDEDKIAQSRQQKSMLFEIAVVMAERSITDGSAPPMVECVNLALVRQRTHFDARIPPPLSDLDEQIAMVAASNLVSMLRDYANQISAKEVIVRPNVPGFGWIGSGVGDFAIGSVLIEVKHTDRNFISNDYRQILLYWLLSYAKGMETGEFCWSHYLLLNPRLNRAAYGSFDRLISSASGGLSRLEIYEYLRAIVRSSSEIRK